MTNVMVWGADQFLESDSQSVGDFVKNSIRQLRSDGQVHGSGLVANISTDLLNNEISYKPSG